jgi:16S rRNA processing protein RimM
VGEAKPRRILLGRIAGAHGIRGDVLIHAYTEAPENIGAYGPLSDADGTRTFTVASARVTQKGVVARLHGINDRNSAETLKGVELYVDRERLPATGEDEFYQADLVGLSAVDPSGEALGTIVAVHNFGAGDLLEIRLAGTGKTELIPFTDDTVPEVDVAAGRAVVVMPAIGTADEDGPPP